MSKQIGETFGKELAAAGCGNGVSFTVGGTDADVQCGPSANKDAVAAVVAAHNPALKLTDEQSVTMRQARLQLLSMGLLAAVNSAIAAIPSPAGDSVRIEWEYASQIVRGHDTVQQIMGALGLTDAQVDTFFVQAALL